MGEVTNNIVELLDGGRLLPLVEDFYTIQGEGYHTGKAAYFIRLGGCDVGCRWCDAKYTWNPRLYPPVEVATIVARATACAAQAVVVTGGEPLLYPLGVLTSELHARGLSSSSKLRVRTPSAANSTGYASRPNGSSPLLRRPMRVPTS